VKETQLQKKIVDWAKKRPLCWNFKTHGGGYTQAGIPDVVGNVGPLALYLECKVGTNKPSPIQTVTIRKIRESGAVAGCVWTFEDAVAVVEKLEGFVSELDADFLRRLDLASPSMIRCLAVDSKG